MGNCTQRWDVDKNDELCVLLYSNSDKKVGGEMRFSSYNFNNLNIEITNSKFEKKSIEINSEKVPKLMKELTKGELNFQLTTAAELGDMLGIINDQVNEIIKDGQVDERAVVVDGNNPNVVQAKLGRNWDLKIIIDEITYDYVNPTTINN